MPLGVAFIQETTVFREFGPLAGNTMRLSYNASPPLGGLLSRQTLDVDVRHYLRIGGSGLLATRLKGYKSFGELPDFMYFGGNGDMRGYDYLSFVGQNAVYANAELRFPLIEAALTPIGVIGGVRGVFFADIGGGWFKNQPSSDPCTTTGYKFATTSSESCTPVLGVKSDTQGNPLYDPLTGLPSLHTARRAPCRASGCRMDARRTASGSRRSRSASRFTSTGRGARCSTRTGKMSCSPGLVAARRFAKPGSPSGSATTSSD